MREKPFERVLDLLSDKLKVVGAACLFGMAVLTCVDVIGRLFDRPLFGSIELVSFLGVITMAMAMPLTQREKGHIGVELFVDKLPKTGRLLFELVTEIASFLLFVVISWRILLHSAKLRASGEVSMNLHLPEYAVVFLLGCCCLILCLVILSSVITTLKKLVSA